EGVLSNRASMYYLSGQRVRNPSEVALTTSCWATGGIAKAPPSRRRKLSFVPRAFLSAVCAVPREADSRKARTGRETSRSLDRCLAEESLPKGRYSEAG